MPIRKKHKHVKQMKYPCIPLWMKHNEKDEFDYPLRSKEEVYFEQYSTGQVFPMISEIRTFSEPQAINIKPRYDMRNEVVIIININLINRLILHYSLTK